MTRNPETTPRAALVAAMATWINGHPDHLHLTIAATALAAIEAAGCVVVPREATPEMLRVADNAMPPPYEDDPDDERFVLYATWRAQWVAMLAASPYAKEPANAE